MNLPQSGGLPPYFCTTVAVVHLVLVRLQRCSGKSRSFAGCWALSWWPSVPWVARFSCIGSLAARRDRCLSLPWLLSDRPLWLPVCNSFFLKFSLRFDAIDRHYWRESGGEW